MAKKLTMQIAKLCPNKLICLENSEHNLYKIQEEFYEQIKEKKLKIKFYSSTWLNTSFLETLFKQNKINTIFHAAAYKHVPLIEDNIY